jgi:DNA polymerase-1
MNKNKTTLLIDADVLAFEAAVVAEEPIEWKDEMWTVHADMALAKARVVNRVEEFKDMMKTNKVTMCLTDRGNFRRVLNPDYKANRSKSRLPIILRQVKKWIIDEMDRQRFQKCSGHLLRLQPWRIPPTNRRGS